MTTPTAPNPPVDALGVVDPIRIPGLDRATRGWRRLPAVGRLFVALAAIDLTARSFGLGGISPTFAVEFPITILPTITHVAVVLMPAAMLVRRRDAAASTPVLFRGAVALALVELLAEWIFRLIPFGDDISVWAGVQILVSACRTGAYAALGYGLARLAREEPRPVLAGTANLVAAAVGGSAIAWLVAEVVTREQRDAELFADTRLSNAFVTVSLVAFAYLARAIVRGTDDRRRPVRARYLATSGMVLAAIDAAILAALAVYVAWRALFAPALPQPEGVFGLGWFGSGLALLLLAVAFALGLGDTSGRIPRLDGEPWDDPEPDGETLRWPEPGREVPAYHEESKP